MIHNAEIEKSILGCLMLDNKLIETAQREINSTYFYNGLYSRLFDEIIEVFAKKGIADLTVLKTLDIEDLVEIMDFVPTTESFKRYKKELIALKSKRELLKSLDEIKLRLNNEHEDMEDIKLDCLGIINDIKIEDKCDEKSCVGDIVMESIDLLEKRNSGEKVFKKWGIKWLDEKTGGIKPALTYLAARPSIGKTALALQLGKYMAKQGGKIAFFSLEMDKVSICNRLICNAGGINKTYFDSGTGIPEDVWATIGKTANEVMQLPLYIYDKYFTIEEIILTAEEQRAKHGLDVLILDYVQLCESKQKFNSTNDRISYISRQLKKYQQKTGIHILALSQFNRETETKKFPTLANLRDSGSLEQDGNNVFFLHEEYCDPEQVEKAAHRDLLLIIAKQREGERNICCKLKFYGNTQRFYQD